MFRGIFLGLMVMATVNLPFIFIFWTLSTLITALLALENSLPFQYLEDISDGSTPATITVCPAKPESCAGTLYLNRPGMVYNVSQSDSTLRVTLAIDPGVHCKTDHAFFGFYLSFRSFENSSDPAYWMAIVNDARAKVVSPNRTLLREVLSASANLSRYPSSQIQFTTGLYHDGNQYELELDLMLRREMFDGITHSLAIDYVVIANGSVGNPSWARCDNLEADIPTHAYCLGRPMGILTCPYNCQRLTGVLERYDFDDEGYAYGSCGVEREGSKCGNYPLEDKQSDFQQSSSALAGIIAAAVIVFVLGPAVVLCIVWQRHKH